jgi:hypothetical protein
MRIVGFLGGIIGLTIVGVMILWLVQYPVATAVVVTLIVGVILLLVMALVWSAASWWTARTMERGAGIVLRAQQANDAWDARKTTSLTQLTTALIQLMREGMKVGRLESGSSGTPSLPLPSQEIGWLPALSSFNTPLNRMDDDSEADEMKQSIPKFIKEE